MRGIPHWQPWQAELGWLTLRIMSIHHLDTFQGFWFGDPERDLLQHTSRPPHTISPPHRRHLFLSILEYAAWIALHRHRRHLDRAWRSEGCAADIHIKWRIEAL